MADRRPFRTEIRAADADTLAVANEGRRDPYRPADAALALIADYAAGDVYTRVEPRRMPTDDELARWTTHPDERVRAALLERPAYYWIDPMHRQGSHELTWEGHKEVLLEQMVAEAEAEGTLWTPLLAKAASVDWTAMQTVLKDAARAMEPWLADEATVADVEAMLDEIPDSGIVWAAMKAAGCLTPDLVERIYEDFPRSVPLVHLAENPTLPQAAIDRLTERMVADMEQRAATGESHSTENATGLAALMRNGHRVREDHLLRVWALAEAPLPESFADRSKVQQSLDFLNQRVVAERFEAATERVLLEIYPYVKDDADELARLLRHPNAGPEIKRRALLDSRIWAVEALAAAEADLRADPTLRHRLRVCRSPEAQAALAADAEFGMTDQLLGKLVAAERWDLVTNVLEALPAGIETGLGRDDLTHLLESDSRRRRLAAISVLGMSRDGETRGRSR